MGSSPAPALGRRAHWGAQARPLQRNESWRKRRRAGSAGLSLVPCGALSPAVVAAVFAALHLFPLPAQAQGVCTSRCPDTSVCRLYQGTPVCLCPDGQQLAGGRCTAGPLPFSDWTGWMNSARAAVGSPSFLWDTDLEAAARAYAAELGSVRGCPLRHPRRLRGIGQCLAGGSGNIDVRTTNTTAVLRWVAEGALYNYSLFDGRKGGCRSRSWRSCGHYLQVIWESSTRVGCGVAPCLSGSRTSRVWVCNFKPPGNVIGRYPYRMDPCFTAQCPSAASCDSSSGRAVCRCPGGQVVVNASCQPDPCIHAAACPGELVCDPSSSSPQCSCPRGRVPSFAGSSLCVPPACQGALCPPSARCIATAAGTPFCACPPPAVLQGGACTSSPSSPLILTSVALYISAANSPPTLVRFSRLGECVPLRGLQLASYAVLWRANASLPGAAPAAQSVASAAGDSCSHVQFWNHGGCIGRSMGWSSSQGNIPRRRATGIFSAAVSIKCA